MALAAPGVPVLGAVIHQEQEPSGRKTLDETIEERLRLRVDPVEVLEHEREGLHATLPEHEALARLERSLAALGRVQRLPPGIVDRDVEDGQEDREGWQQGLIEGD